MRTDTGDHARIDPGICSLLSGNAKRYQADGSGSQLEEKDTSLGQYVEKSRTLGIHSLGFTGYTGS